MAARRSAEVSRAPAKECVFCGVATVVRVSVKSHDQPGEPEVSRRICVHCFKAIVDYMTSKPK